jgi:hypothetical protein
MEGTGNVGRGGHRPGAGRKPGLKRVVIRAGDLARLSQEESQVLDTIARKLAPDTPQNQKESKPAIETAVTT